MWPFERKIEDILFNKIKVSGVPFLIKRLDPSNFMDGSRVMVQTFDIYKIKSDSAVAEASLAKIKEHYKDVFMASILDPKIKRKDDEPTGLFVDHLFTDWDFAHNLYLSIMEFTYGKKKIKRNTSRAREFQI
jgi:hypothetical protein